MNDDVLTASDLAATYGGTIRALRGVSLEIADRQVVAVLGSNGAGKTTLLRAISGTLGAHGGRLTRGRIELDGQRLSGRGPADIVRASVVQVPEGRHVFGRLTVEENLRAGGFVNRDREARQAAQARVHELFPVLAERGSQRAALLSGGEQQMLAIGRALMGRPKLLLLDEPSLGLAPQVVGRVGEVIKEINQQGIAVLLIEQNATMALEVADHAYVLEVGKVSLDGSAEDLSGTDEVRELYLGGRADSAMTAMLDSRKAEGARLGKWVG